MKATHDKTHPLIFDLSKTVADLAADGDYETIQMLRESISFVFEAADDVYEIDTACQGVKEL